MAKKAPEVGDYKYGFSDRDVSIFRTERGLTEEVVREISRRKEAVSYTHLTLPTNREV